jgi:hypothetical protein
MNQRPTLAIQRSNWYQVRAPVENVNSHLIQSARVNIVEHYDLHLFQSTAERLEYINSLLVNNRYLFPVAGCVEGDVCGPNPTQRESKANNEWLVCTVLSCGGNPTVCLHQMLSSGEEQRKVC